MNDQPIGIFDSGIGGLTVTRAIQKKLPHESLLYLGDTARVPYGTKSPDVIIRYVQKCVSFLLKKGAKIIVIACNTASSVSFNDIKKEFSIPILGVIEPGVDMALEYSTSNRIGLIGTEVTIRTHVYQLLLKQKSPNIHVFSKICPLFVPLVEEGMKDHRVTKILAEEYLKDLLENNIDTLILGCTHYPILKNVIQDICGSQIKIVDSAVAVALSLKKLLNENHLISEHKKEKDRFFTTDKNTRFQKIGSTFLETDMGIIEWVDL